MRIVILLTLIFLLTNCNHNSKFLHKKTKKTSIKYSNMKKMFASFNSCKKKQCIPLAPQKKGKCHFTTANTKLDKQKIEFICDTIVKPTNFAKNYWLIFWSCGTSCSTGVIIDQAYKLYSLPTAEWGYAFRLDSNLLIENPPTKNRQYRPNWANSIYYHWKNNKFIKLEI